MDEVIYMKKVRIIFYFSFFSFMSILFFSNQLLAIDLSTLTKEDYRLYREFVEWSEEKRFAGKSEKKRFKGIARLLKVKSKVLKEAYEKVQSVGTKEEIAEQIKQDILNAIKANSVKGRLKIYTLKDMVDDVVMDLSSPNPVGYVRWKNIDKKDLEEEACLIALAFKQKGHLIETISMAAIKKGTELKVFSAKISNNGFMKIDKKRISSFADKRYIKLFEDIKH